LNFVRPITRRSWWPFLVLLISLAMVGLIACSSGGDDDDNFFDPDSTEQDEDEEESKAPTTSPDSDPVISEPGQPSVTITPNTDSTASDPGEATATSVSVQPKSNPTVSAVTSPLPGGAAATGGPEIFSLIDIIFTDLTTGQEVFDIAIEQEFGDSPTAAMEPLVDGISFEALIFRNMEWLAGQGYQSVEVPTVAGFGDVFLESAALAPLRHKNVNYNGQYEGKDPENDLKIDELDAYLRYHTIPGVFQSIVSAAKANGIAVTGNVESIAHIINRAQESGIGGGEDELVLAGLLPIPTIDQVITFIDDVIDAGAVRISAEAYPLDYDNRIAEHLASRGIPYKHTGAEIGDLWTGYYYSFYPDKTAAGDALVYLHSACAIIGNTNASVFARARASGDDIDTAVVVGAYVPYPCNTSLSIADVYNDDGSGSLHVELDAPTFSDGSAAPNCTTDLWTNLLLVATNRQGIDTIEFAADLSASVSAVSTPGLAARVRERILSHPIPSQNLPIANVIVDLPVFGEDDGISTAEFYELIRDVQLGLVDDALQAAGYQTVLTFDEPWTGGDVSLTYILTAGGNEETGEEFAYGFPYWNAQQDIDPRLHGVVSSATTDRPVFIHPIYGIPEKGIWSDLRTSMGLPARFPYANPSFGPDEEYRTSLLTSWALDSAGEVTADGMAVPITPLTGSIAGQVAILTPFGDVTRIGQTANFIDVAEVPTSNIVFSAPLRVQGSGGLEEKMAPYLVTDGNGLHMWMVSQIHHEGFTFAMSEAIARSTSGNRVLEKPAYVHLYSGRQTFALAYDHSDVSLNLPFTPGELIDVTVYNPAGLAVEERRGVAYDGPVMASLEKYGLLVVEPAL